MTYHFDIQEPLAIVNHYADNLEYSALLIEYQMIIDMYLQHLFLLSFKLLNVLDHLVKGVKLGVFLTKVSNHPGYL
jgi:hypothetical protein